MLKLRLRTHEATTATHEARWPLASDDLSRVGETAADRREPLACRVVVAPERRALRTAELLGAGETTTEPRFADLDAGGGAGLAMAEVPLEQLAAWTSDTGYRGHGGESLDDLRQRVAEGLDSLGETGDDGAVEVVAHPSTARMAVLHALGAPTQAFWRIDIGPGHEVRLHGRAGRWTLRM